MARKAVQLARKPDGERKARIGGVEPHFLETYILHAATPAEEIAGQQPHHVFGESECFADIANGTLAAIGDDGGGDSGAMTAVLLVNVLNHLLTPLMLEIDIDVRRFVALGG